MVDDLDLRGIVDPEARHLLGVMVARLQGLEAEQEDLRSTHAALLAAYHAVVAENAALREELARWRGDPKATPACLPRL